MDTWQGIVVGLILLGATAVALALLTGLWGLGLRLLDRLSSKRASFELIVALRHLRGRKSGYLKAMTVVVLIAVTLVNCSLPTVLSVMGGFGNDLKQKILAATAHVLVDSERPNVTLSSQPTDEELDGLVTDLQSCPSLRVLISAPRQAQGDSLARRLASHGIDEERIEVGAPAARQQGIQVFFSAFQFAGQPEDQQIQRLLTELRDSPNVNVVVSSARQSLSRELTERLLAEGIEEGRIETRTSGQTEGIRVSFSSSERGLSDYTEIGRQVAEVEGVVGVTPFVEGDVMLASQTNIASVVLKGVESQTMHDVIKLRDTIEQGHMEYLDQPEKVLIDVMAEREQRLQLFLADGGLEFRDAGTDGAPAKADPPPLPSKAASENVPQEDENTLPAVIVGRELAKTLRVFVGDEVNVVSPLGGMGPMGPIPKARPFRVGGVFYSGMYQDDAKNAYVRLDVAQEFLGMEGKASNLRIRVDDIETAGGVSDDVRAVLGPRYRVRPWEEVNANLFSALRLEKIAMFAVYSVFFIICAFLIASTLTMMVLEKRRGLAVLKTIGASNGRLGAVFMLQGLLAGVVGTISGQISGLAASICLGRFVEIDPEVYYIDRLPVNIEPMEFASVAFFGLVTALVATLLPLLATVMLRPVDGLRL